MGMYMVNPVLAAPAGKHSRLHRIGKMSEEASIRMPAHLCGENKNLRECSWLPQERCNKTAQEFCCARAKHELRLALLALVDRVDQGLRCTPQRVPYDAEPQLFEGENFAPYKGVADRRVLICEIGNAQG